MTEDLVSLLLDAAAGADRRCYAFVPAGGDTIAEAITFEDLLARALSTAAGLRELGVGPGQRVALFARPDVSYVVAVAATLLAGATVAPVNHQFKRRELQSYLEVIAPALVVTDGETDALVSESYHGARVISAPSVSAADGSVRLTDLGGRPPIDPARPDPSAAAFIMHTSGTTGLPKGVVRSHRAYARFSAIWAERYMDADDVVLSFMPMYHQGGVMMSLLPALRRGVQMIQMERFSVPSFWSTARRYGTTWAIFMPPVPSYLRLHDDLEPVAHPFRWAMTGGRVDHWDEMQHRFGIVGHSGYGSTETTMVTMTGARRDGPATAGVLRGPLGGFACGRPIDGWNELRVVRDDGTVAGPLEVGLLEFRGPGVLERYFGHAEPATSTEGWFRPGDVGYLDAAGQLFMIDRVTDLIRRSGENISPREIEDVLNDHPDVEEAAVVPVPDEVRGQELRACIVMADGATTRPEELFDHCLAHLSPFKVPRYLDVRDALPHTPTMKIKKDVLVAERRSPSWIERGVSRSGG